ITTWQARPCLRGIPAIRMDRCGSTSDKASVCTAAPRPTALPTRAASASQVTTPVTSLVSYPKAPRSRFASPVGFFRKIELREGNFLTSKSFGRGVGVANPPAAGRDRANDLRFDAECFHLRDHTGGVVLV